MTTDHQKAMLYSAASASTRRWLALLEMQEGPNPLGRDELKAFAKRQPSFANVVRAYLNGIDPPWIRAVYAYGSSIDYTVEIREDGMWRVTRHRSGTGDRAVGQWHTEARTRLMLGAYICDQLDEQLNKEDNSEQRRSSRDRTTDSRPFYLASASGQRRR